MRRIGKFFNLRAEEKTVFSQSSLQFQQLKTVIGNVSRKITARQSARISSISPARVAGMLNAAGKIVPFTTCLSKALAGSILFSSLGYETKLHFGVCREKCSMLEAHAWLTFDRRVTVGYLSDLGRYVELQLGVSLDILETCGLSRIGTWPSSFHRG